MLFCAAPRCNHLLRLVPPALTRVYAEDHDAAILRCLAALLLQDPDGQLPDAAVGIAALPLRLVGLGLHPAAGNRHAAYWASWCDSLPVIQARAPAVAATLTLALGRGGAGAPALAAAAQAAGHLRDLRGRMWHRPRRRQVSAPMNPAYAVAGNARRVPDLAAALQAQLELSGGAVLPSARSLADALAPLVEAAADHVGLAACASPAGPVGGW